MLYQYNRHHEIKVNLYAIILGLVAAYTGYIFRTGVEIVDSVFFGDDNSIANLVIDFPIILRFLILVSIPTVGGIIVGYGVWKISIEAKGHGIPNVMQSMYVEEGNIRTRVPIAKFLLSILTIGSGNSAGSEGPIAQIGAGLGSYIGKKLKLNTNEINILIAAGAAAGIAAVFNAPLGGALFGIEILLASISLRSVVPVIIASATAITTNSLIIGDYYSVFTVPQYNVSYGYEYILFIILAVIIAAVGMLWQKTFSILEHFFDNWNFPFYLKTGLGGLGVGILLFFTNWELRGSSYPLIQKALLGYGFDTTPHADLFNLFSIMLLYVVIKILVTSLTLGSGNSGGVFSPSLLMGAFTGAAFGVLLNIIFPNSHINPGLYAVLGLAALFGSIARAPLTMIIISTEMSGEYLLFPALMITVSIAYLIHNYFMKESIYTEPLAEKFGLSIRIRNTDEVMNYILVEDVMSPSVICVYEDTLTRLMGGVFTTYHHLGYLVVSRDYQLKGIVTFRDYQHALLFNQQDDPVSEIMSKNVIYANPGDNIKHVTDVLYKNGIGRLPVVVEDPKTKNKFAVGMFSRSDLIKALESLEQTGKEHDARVAEIKTKIVEPLIDAMPSRFPHLKDQVIILQYDWANAYKIKQFNE